jgi:hypothetical protein
VVLFARLLVMLVGFLAACLGVGMVMTIAVLYPEWSEVRLGVDDGTFAVAAAIGFVVVSGFALIPAAILILISEAFSIRGVLAYAVGGALAGLACYLTLVRVDAGLAWEGVVRRELEVMTGAGIVGGLIYWMVAGRTAGLWRQRP